MYYLRTGGNGDGKLWRNWRRNHTWKYRFRRAAVMAIITAGLRRFTDWLDCITVMHYWRRYWSIDASCLHWRTRLFQWTMLDQRSRATCERRRSETLNRGSRCVQRHCSRDATASRLLPFALHDNDTIKGNWELTALNLMRRAGTVQGRHQQDMKWGLCKFLFLAFWPRSTIATRRLLVSCHSVSGNMSPVHNIIFFVLISPTYTVTHCSQTSYHVSTTKRAWGIVYDDSNPHRCNIELDYRCFAKNKRT